MVKTIVPWKEGQETLYILLQIADTPFRKMAIQNLSQLIDTPNDDYNSSFLLYESLTILNSWYSSCYPVGALVKVEDQLIFETLIVFVI